MANPAMEVNEAEEIAYWNAPMAHQLAETPHDNRKLQDQTFVTEGINGSDWSLDESDGNSGQSGDYQGYPQHARMVTGGDGGGS